LQPCLLPSHPAPLVWLARRSLSFMVILFALKMRSVFRIWSRILYAVYVPSSAWWPLIRLSELATATLLLLPALLGLVVELVRKVSGKPARGMFGQLAKPTPKVSEQEKGKGEGAGVSAGAGKPALA
jgi:hypothetical protein